MNETISPNSSVIMNSFADFSEFFEMSRELLSSCAVRGIFIDKFYHHKKQSVSVFLFVEDLLLSIRGQNRRKL